MQGSVHEIKVNVYQSWNDTPSVPFISINQKNHIFTNLIAKIKKNLYLLKKHPLFL